MTTPLKQILYVEDDADIRKITEMTLSMLGNFDITACECGQDALEKAKTTHAQLVILDVMMPDMDGPTVFRHLRTYDAYKDTPIVFMTAKVQANEIAAYMDMGAVGVIPKPYEPAELPGQIQALWEKSQG
ncbi:response regulator [Kistimonas scapharcae]|uniref:Response regulator n=1 Tax=Kistimonas scapharcae TaxID=1036133 RepID=A0ABP8V3S4_9GAMM